MSIGGRIPFQEAYDLAEEAAEQLRPTVEYLKAVGSLRRKNAKVGDIEFLARPHSSPDLFGDGAIVHLTEVRDAMQRIGTWKKGGSRMMQITDLLGREGTRLELYLVHAHRCTCTDCATHGPSAWGSMLAIRTGPEDLGRYCVMRMKARGYRHQYGHAQKIGTEEFVPTDTEEDFFELAGVPCLSPQLRDDQAEGLWSAYQQQRGARV